MVQRDTINVCLRFSQVLGLVLPKSPTAFIRMKIRKRQGNLWWKFGIIFLLLMVAFIYLESQSLETHSDTINGKQLGKLPTLPVVESPARGGCGRRLLASNNSGIYPPDVFTLEQKRKGAVLLHIVGMIYMFAALAIVCDEFFVPALGVIIEKLQVSDDVAGATFMAAGGSAPELSTSIIGVFLANSDVGIGTIVGSAVFNILFVIGMCTVFSKSVLQLTWWPLFRDVLFYCASILVLIACFYDYHIDWYESLCLLVVYGLYVSFMKFNVQIETWVKAKLHKNNRIANGRETTRQRRVSVSHFRNHSMYRQGALQLLLHTLDPLRENQQSSEKVMTLENLGKAPQGTEMSPKSGLSSSNSQNNLIIRATGEMIIGVNGITASSSSNGNLFIGAHGDMAITVSSGEADSANENSGQSDCNNGEIESRKDVHVQMANEDSLAVANGNGKRKDVETDEDKKRIDSMAEEPEEIEEPLDIGFPKGTRKRITYILLIPLVLPLWFTLPDVRRPEKRKFFPVTFLGSIIWIAIFSYLMVWWAVEVADTINFPEPVMGLTFLAAGTSIPDLITSVIVARKGLGDMAVSSSVGSNIFDITVGLPFPWLIWSLVHSLDAVKVTSVGLFCSILLLFLMLLFVIISIAVCRWRMTKALGITMFVLYVVFLTLALLLEYNKIPCISFGA